MQPWRLQASRSTNCARTRLVSAIRACGALHDAIRDGPVTDDHTIFAAWELDQVISKLKGGSSSLFGSYSSIKATCSGGRHLLLVLVNLIWAFQVLPALSVAREFIPIRKKEPTVVRSISCLRPISMASDLAGVVDGLWLLRVGGKLQQFWGPAQSGGVHEALSLVVGLLLLCQLQQLFLFMHHSLHYSNPPSCFT